MRSRTLLPAVTLALAVAGTAALSVVLPVVPAPAEAAGPAGCVRQSRIDVPRAELQKTACLDDLTTAGTVASGHTNVDDWTGLHAPGTRNPTGVPGHPDRRLLPRHLDLQHQQRLEPRQPVRDPAAREVERQAGGQRRAGHPAAVRERLRDQRLGAGQGYAFAEHRQGQQRRDVLPGRLPPGGSIREWNRRVTQLTRATKAVVAQRYGHAPKRTYMFGISNGGYLTRWQLENRPGLYDGGLDWEGTLFRAAGPNLLTYLPAALRELPGVRRHGRRGRARRDDPGRLREGLGVPVALPPRLLLGPDPAASTARSSTPTYDGALDAGIPFCPAGRRPATPTTTTRRDRRR